MSKGHEGNIDVALSFSRVFVRLSAEAIELRTENGTRFEACATVSRSGERVIRFKQHGKEYARSYECCWGNYTNCSGTRIGMYCAALDQWAKS